MALFRSCEGVFGRGIEAGRCMGLRLNLLPFLDLKVGPFSRLYGGNIAYRICLAKSMQTQYRFPKPGLATVHEEKVTSAFLKGRKLVPPCDPPSAKDINLLYEFIDKSRKLMVLTGAGMSTECGIPDYRSPNGAYSSGYKPMTHQEFVRSTRARTRYWARSYAGWRRFTKAQPGAAHIALASLGSVGRLDFLVTQNVDRLHHRAGSSALELHGTVYSVICLECGHTFCRHLFQDQLRSLNPLWASAIDHLEDGDPGSDANIGMIQRPDGDIDVDEKFWEDKFQIPNCEQCNGTLKPDVVFFGDNVPKDRADKAMEAAKDCDALLVVGSSVMTMSAYRLVSRHGHRAGVAQYPAAFGATGPTLDRACLLSGQAIGQSQYVDTWPDGP